MQPTYDDVKYISNALSFSAAYLQKAVWQDIRQFQEWQQVSIHSDLQLRSVFFRWF